MSKNNLDLDTTPDSDIDLDLDIGELEYTSLEDIEDLELFNN